MVSQTQAALPNGRLSYDVVNTMSSSTLYIIPYQVHRNRVELIAVFHGRQRWPDVL